jgi:excisionase family DNA binding protein
MAVKEVDRLITATEAGEMLGVNARTVRMWAQQGLPALKTPGGHYRFKPTDLVRFVARVHPVK